MLGWGGGGGGGRVGRGAAAAGRDGGVARCVLCWVGEGGWVLGFGVGWEMDYDLPSAVPAERRPRLSTMWLVVVVWVACAVVWLCVKGGKEEEAHKGWRFERM